MSRRIPVWYDEQQFIWLSADADVEWTLYPASFCGFSPVDFGDLSTFRRIVKS